MDLRPQGHDIIRTWLFSTMVRSHFEHGTAPWRHAALSGWILDPDRKKMSKSKGNVVTPMGLLEQYGSDACATGPPPDGPAPTPRSTRRPDEDRPTLAIKLLHASRFALSFAGDPDGEVHEPLDSAMLADLASLVDDATASFEAFDYARALERTEAFFWWFCDDYLELVKVRAYGDDGPARSAANALARALSTLQRLLAPFLPFATEEVWSWWMAGSIHRSAWPDGESLRAAAGEWNPYVMAVASDVIREVRRAKSEARRSMKAEVSTATVTDGPDRIAALRDIESDVRSAGNIAELITLDGEFAVSVDLVDEAPPM
jgi:valyl-tRNA synthetase